MLNPGDSFGDYKVIRLLGKGGKANGKSERQFVGIGGEDGVNVCLAFGRKRD